MLTYLSCPYGRDPALQAVRMAQFWDAVGVLLMQGHWIVSPMTLEPAVAQKPMQRAWLNWKDYSLGLMSKCDNLFVLKLDGWSTSEGVLAEMAEAQRLCIPVTFISMENLQESIYASGAGG